MKRPTKTQKRFEQGRAAARQRVIERGIVAVRADPAMMDLLLTVEEHARVPYGVIARSWVMDRLRQESKNIEL